MILSDQSVTVGSQGRNSRLELEAETKGEDWLLVCFLAHAQLTFISYTDSPAYRWYCPQWARPCHAHTSLIDMTIGQPHLDKSSTEAPCAWVTLGCIKLTMKNVTSMDTSQ